ncbi:hypothetical protein FOA52_000565 [Chlamydomonas sp. UWO 241]|nr:hypothetical protein FOA52_000565 [Chlamydomonas sp. UWO 241]
MHAMHAWGDVPSPAAVVCGTSLLLLAEGVPVLALAKLSELSGLIRLGQKANWLVLEEAILEVRSHKGACAYASVDVQPLGSKNEAYTLFGRIAEHNLTVARSEEAVAGARGKDGGDSDEGEGGGSLGGLLGRLMGRPVRDEAMVITLLVACKGGISAPETIESWTDVESVLTQLCGLSPDKLMGIELLWTPHDLGCTVANMGSHKSTRLKKILSKAQNSNKPIPHWIRYRTDNKIRYNAKRRHWRRTKMGI